MGDHIDDKGPAPWSLRVHIPFCMYIYIHTRSSSHICICVYIYIDRDRHRLSKCRLHKDRGSDEASSRRESGGATRVSVLAVYQDHPYMLPTRLIFNIPIVAYYNILFTIYNMRG